MPITTIEYQKLDEAYKFFNDALFDGNLPECLIALSSEGGRKNYGIFYPGTIKSRTDKDATFDKLVLNIANFPGKTDQWILSILVHEMVHVWEHHFGKSKYSKFSYHGKAWGAKMKALGLYPSNTGEVGGKETGRQMMHYVIEGGQFEQAAEEWLSSRVITFQSAEYTLFTKEKKKKKKTTCKYECPNCGEGFTGKLGLNILCGDCSSEDETVKYVEIKTDEEGEND